jgi:hypothetical protein
MSIIESVIYVNWIQDGTTKSKYICVPATLLIIGDINPKTQFIFWN